MARVFVGVASNVEPARNVRAALLALADAACLRGLSTFYRTPALGRRGQPDYYNGVVELETGLPPHLFKRMVLRRIEAELGRQRGRDRDAPRTIDLDLLLYDELLSDDPDLPLPDPLIGERPFLARGLAELCPDLRLPGSRLAVRELAARSAPSLTPLGDYTASLREEVLGGPGEGGAARAPAAPRAGRGSGA